TFGVQPLHRVEDGSARVDVQRVAELVRLRRRHRLDARAQMTGVVPPGAAAADRSQQVAQRPIAEEVERLVRDLETNLPGVLSHSAAGPAAMLALAGEVRRVG